MSAEFIVFDDSESREIVGIAMQEAHRAGLNPVYFRDAEEAVEAVGFFTLGTVTSSGIYSYLRNRYVGITLIQAAEALEIPRAIFHDEIAEELVGKFVRPDGIDVFVPREPYHEAESVIRTWVSTLTTAA